ncbi:MAG TPA: hypothetical protein PKW66_14395, partial [Polyangiaceae bacterium]|nr:hypothetical protein [Polyangiaceae bacterium]
MKRSLAHAIASQPVDPVHRALVRARRARKKGQARHEVHALREACAHEEWDATLWTMLGAACMRQQRWDEAAAALRHALWLRERTDEPKRAMVTRKLLGLAQRGAG